MRRAYYEASSIEFLKQSESEILGELAERNEFDLEHQQRGAWLHQIRVLKSFLPAFPSAHIYMEFIIPRMGKRVDIILLVEGIIFVIEYKVGSDSYESHGFEQVLDYALDLKNFHEGSHDRSIAPILVASRAPEHNVEYRQYEDGVAHPAYANDISLKTVIESFLDRNYSNPIDPNVWADSPYKPTPTIVEAAQALYRGHEVQEISRSDAGAINLSQTSSCISQIIENSKSLRRKSICLVTGVPGSGKTLAGLNIANERMKAHEDEHAVFLSGNGPLVKVLREALANDEVEQSKEVPGRGPISKKEAERHANTFIQNIHHFRDDNLRSNHPPVEKVVVFDEAQRAWTMEQTSKFMQTKKGIPNFSMSEPEFLLSVMDRHSDWCTVICLVGGGQEINVGEAGLNEWFEALRRRFSGWDIYCSDRIVGKEYNWGNSLSELIRDTRATIEPNLHLSVSIRSFRAERLSEFVHSVIDGDAESARSIISSIDKYPIVLTRDLKAAKSWLRARARGSERYGLVSSSNALRLKPLGIHVKAKIDPPIWFLKGKEDVRSSYYLEDVASEFEIQGLELDWVGICWDANFRRDNNQWSLHRFSGTKWQNLNDNYRRAYLANSYRVLLTRARQGMVIFVPEGDSEDPTRLPEYYDGTFDFLSACGLPTLK